MKKNTFLFFLVFLGGVICANILGITSGRELGAMNEYFINRYLYANIHGRELFPFLFYKRMPEFFLLLLLSAGLYGTLIVDIYFCFLGFSAGFLSVISIMNYGIRGILLMMGFLLPQWLLYIPALILWRYELRRRKGIYMEYASGGQQKKRRFKHAGMLALAGMFLFFGLLAESYVNPFFLQQIIRTIEI